MNVLIATGGSGGHIFPAIKVGLECKENEEACLFVGSLKFGTERLDEYGFDYELMDTCGWKRFQIWKAFHLSLTAIRQSFRIFKEFQPDVVLGFGGYSSFPVCLAAFLKGIPLGIHEQNAIPGKANKILSLFAQKVFLSFKKSISFFPKEKCSVTGCPSLAVGATITREEARRYFNFSNDIYTILIFGGSQGSQNINYIFKEAVRELHGHFSFQVIHLSGSKKEESLNEIYRSEGVEAYVASFLERMDYAYKAADLVIARSGALTVTEVRHYQKAAIFIPYPHAKGHQKANAATLHPSEFAVIMEERALTASALMNAIRNQYERHSKIQGDIYTEDFNINPAYQILEEVRRLAAC